MRKLSDLTVTDQFCGAGGSSLGAKAAGLRVVVTVNHWKLAVETHTTNFLRHSMIALIVAPGVTGATHAPIS